jgi:hypothetical protein
MKKRHSGTFFTLLVVVLSVFVIGCDNPETGSTYINNGNNSADYNDTLTWLNNFINSTALQKDMLLSEVSANPRTWCGIVNEVEETETGIYTISLYFNSFNIGAPRITMITHNRNKALEASNNKDGLFTATNRGNVTYFHYIYHTISFDID